MRDLLLITEKRQSCKMLFSHVLFFPKLKMYEPKTTAGLSCCSWHFDNLKSYFLHYIFILYLKISELLESCHDKY